MELELELDFGMMEFLRQRKSLSALMKATTGVRKILV